MSDRRVRELDYHLAEMERRLANVVRLGTVKEVDPAKGKVRVEIAKDPEGLPVLTPWLKWSERAGKIKTWLPPSVGEQVKVIAPSGDLAQGWVDAGGFSDANPAPSSDGSEHVVTIDDITFKMRGNRGSLAIKDGGRAEVTPQIAKLKVGDKQWLVVTEESIVVSSEPIVGPDPDANQT
jgi:phage baseplate assembly protein gpV